ncbi:serine hydrolase [Romeria aff. gracilis LEGE 07310]|uniref:Serine hydrolase n=1 Tax=Vasconcelosia minhoensis LEGE 07310 TaxID=915328 RepID=A0A8J7AUN8_9CYAN|nr:serine hydrolase [Romeria gracilis]MBE9075792.1 serine hydrolase [Romeria aff. gracilis LEGE 07310]
MPRLWIPTAVVLNALAITLGLAAIRPRLAIAPDLLQQHAILSQMAAAEDLGDLYGLRDRIQRDLVHLDDSTSIQTPAQAKQKTVQKTDLMTPYRALTQLRVRLSRNIEAEEAHQAIYQRATELANQAVMAHQSPDDSLASLQKQEFLWRGAIGKLEEIPADSVFADEAAAKSQQYKRIVSPIAAAADRADSAFLQPIAAATGLGERIHITLCQLESNECRSYQGDIPPASPASLIKLPMAVVLMHKVTTENIDLDSEVYIDPGNFTENAQGAKIFVDQTYTLREVMVRMIKESNNIATNQLVDYLGRDYINQTLNQLGYSQTQINTKLVGDSTYPDNAGSGPNRSTTNELTEMMRQIYSFENPGDDEILDALVGQYDWDFGYKALQDMGPAVHWIGEKTGQNSKVIGSSLAVKVGEQRYVMTVAIDNSASQVHLRQVIRGVVAHLLEAGPLDSDPQR